MGSFRLDGKVALITGSTQGIGRAIALDLASRGVKIVGTARSRDPVPELSEKIAALGSSFTFVEADAGKWSDCKRAAEEALAAHGRIDILVNNAGISRPHALMEAIEEHEWRAVTAPTMEGTVAMTRYVLPTMLAQGTGSIVHIASTGAETVITHMGAYCMAKAAVAHHARVVALETMGTGVRCNALLVGGTETEAMKKSLLSLARKARGDDNWVPEEGKSTVHSAARMLQPSELAPVVALLCLDESQEISGATIPVDRGLLAGMFNSKYNAMSAAGVIPPGFE